MRLVREAREGPRYPAALFLYHSMRVLDMKTFTKKQRDLRNNLIAWLLVAPSLIFMLIFTV